MKDIKQRAITVLEACIRLAERPQIPRKVIAARLRRLAREVVRAKQLNPITTQIVMERITKLVRQLER